jgi:hypothetical protein
MWIFFVSTPLLADNADASIWRRNDVADVDHGACERRQRAMFNSRTIHSFTQSKPVISFNATNEIDSKLVGDAKATADSTVIDADKHNNDDIEVDVVDDDELQNNATLHQQQQQQRNVTTALLHNNDDDDDDDAFSADLANTSATLDTTETLVTIARKLVCLLLFCSTPLRIVVVQLDDRVDGGFNEPLPATTSSSVAVGSASNDAPPSSAVSTKRVGDVSSSSSSSAVKSSATKSTQRRSTPASSPTVNTTFVEMSVVSLSRI